MKNTKFSKKNTKAKGKRPKAKVSSHNACRFGYPFFLSPSDDDAMLEIPNPTPSVHQTVCTLFVFFLVPPQKEKKHDSAKLSRKKNSKTSEKRTLHMYPKSPKFQEYQNHYPKCQNHSKINENL